MANKEKLTFTFDIQAEIGQMQAALKSVRKEMDASFDPKRTKELEQQYSSLTRDLANLQKAASKPLHSPQDFQRIVDGFEAIKKQAGLFSDEIKNIRNLTTKEKLKILPENSRKTFENANKALKDYNSTISKNIKKSDELINAERAVQATRNRIATQNRKFSENEFKERQAIEQATKDWAKIEQTTGQKSIEAAQKRQKELKKEVAEQEKRVATTEQIYKDAGKGIKQPRIQTIDGQNYDLKAERAKLAALQEEQNKYNSIVPTMESYTKAQKDIEAAQNSKKDITNKLTVENSLLKDQEGTAKKLKDAWDQANASKNSKALDNLKDKLRESGIAFDDSTTDVNELKTAVEEALNKAVAPMGESVNKITTDLDKFGNTAEDAGNKTATGLRDCVEQSEKFNKSFNFLDRAKQFVGFAGAVQLARRALRGAYQTVKELDAQMAQMAVVTDESISDYWDKLPEYTNRANKLGVAIKDAYASTTLFLQQGLKAAQAEKLADEALKLARIAGIDAAKATNKLTAAMRGFNMEMDQASAQRVSDVYAQLAAKTASDVNEISSAMTKTAAIAQSAGMSFETTSAFLAKGIEATRESAENLGTALKTVVARFTELKKAPDEIGEVDGEIVDANKIETALRTVGIALRDTQGQFRSLDDVFIELSGKWDTLDTNTQRYIATVAAGSRQQSRFIAMMANNARTTELLSEANNSAGASNQQFEKTMESLDAKLNQLKNAWDEFTTGITNSSIIKRAVDLLTLLLKGINGLTDALGGGPAKIALLIAALRAGDKALGAFKVSLKETNSIFSAFGAGLKAGGKSLISWTSLFSNSMKALAGGKKGVAHLQTLQQKYYATQQGLKGLTQGTEEYTNAQNTLKSIQNEIGGVFNLSSKQTKNYNDILNNGIQINNKDVSATEAALFASKGLTAAKLKSLDPEKQSLLLTSLSSGSKLKASIATWLYTSSEEGSTAAKIKGAIATWMLKASMWELLVVALLVVAAVVALIAVIWLIVKAINAEADAQKEENEALKNAAESAQAAKDAYDDLLSSKDNYESLKEELDDLTEGTDEWNKKLLEINDTVLSLIEKFPDLAQYMSLNDKGMLEISGKGWREVITRQRERVAQTQTISAEMQNRASQRSINKQLGKTQNTSGVGPQTLRQEIGKTEIGEQIYAPINKGYEVSTQIVEEYLADSTKGLLAEITDLESKGKEISETESKLLEKKKEQLTTEQEILNNAKQANQVSKTRAAAGLQASIADYGQSAADTALFANAFATGVTQVIDPKKIDELVKSMNTTSDWRDNDQFKDIMDHYGISANTLTGDDLDDLKRVYSEISGQKFNDLDGWSEDRLIEAIATAYESDKYNKQINTRVEQFTKLTKEQQDLARNVLKKDADSLTLKDIEAREATGASEMIEAVAKSLNLSEEDFLKEQGITEEEFSKQTEQAQVELSKYQNKMNDAIGQTFDGLNITLAEYKKFANSMQLLSYKIGKDNATALGNFIQNQIKELDKDQQSKFIDLVSNTDFSDLNNIKAFQEQLGNLNLGYSEKEIKDLSQQLFNLADATRKVTLESLTNQIKELGKIAQSFKEGKYTVSEEDREKLIASGKFVEEDFVYDSLKDEWTVVADQTKYSLFPTMMAAIGDNLDEFVVKETARVQAGERLQGRKNNLAALSDDKLTEDQRREGLNSILNKASLEDIAKALNYEDAQSFQKAYQNMDNEQILKLITDLQELVLNVDKSKGDLKTAQEKVRNASLDYETPIGFLFAEDTELAQKKLKAYAEGNAQYMAMLEKSYTLTGKAQEKFLAELADTISIDESREKFEQFANALENVFTNIQEIDLNDINGAIKVLRDELGESINVNESNYRNFYSVIERMRNGEESAFEDFMNLVVTESGLGVSSIAEVVNTDMNLMSDQAKLAAQYLVDLGLIRETVLSNGARGYITQDAALFTNLQNKWGKEKKADAWKNPYNWLYNMNERINAQLKERERLEARYQRLLNMNKATAQDLYDISTKELKNLEAQAQNQRLKGELALEEIKQTIATAPEQFSSLVMLNAATGEFQVDWDSANKRGWNSDQGSLFEDFVDNLTGLRDEYQDSQDSLDDIYDQVYEIQQRGKDQYGELEQQVKDALIEIRQAEIDRLSQINEAIQNTQSKVLDKMQEQLDETRQIRDNQKTEQELQNKRTKLQYLSRDTGGNLLTIKQLEKELGESEQSYTDSLIDQSIQRIQDQNEKAAEQRQEQIDIMQAQLDYWDQSGQVWTTVTGTLNKSLDQVRNGVDINATKVGEILTKTAEWRGMSQFQKKDFVDELKTSAVQAALYADSSSNSVGSIASSTLNTVQKWKQDLDNTLSKEGTVGAQLDTIGNNLLKVVPKDYTQKLNDIQRSIDQANSNFGVRPTSYTDSVKSKQSAFNNVVKDERNNYYVYSPGAGGYVNINDTRASGQNYFQVNKGAAVYDPRKNAFQSIDNVLTYADLMYKNSIRHFATGGLADFTGPAWLDGTLSQPELVLNAQDTQNFIQLKDILGSILRAGSLASTPQQTGANYFDIEINVDSLGDDYDVEQVADKIRDLIVADAQYRNVNAVNLQR